MTHESRTVEGIEVGPGQCVAGWDALAAKDAAAEGMQVALAQACARIGLDIDEARMNGRGTNTILSAWLPGARAALAAYEKAKGGSR